MNIDKEALFWGVVLKLGVCSVLVGIAIGCLLSACGVNVVSACAIGVAIAVWPVIAFILYANEWENRYEKSLKNHDPD